VIDFDGAMRADPYWEIARFLTYLKKDAPLLGESNKFAPLPPMAPLTPRKLVLGEEGLGGEGVKWMADGMAEESLLERASAAYLRGYQERRGAALDPARLAWFRMCCEIHFLARLLQRDRVTPAVIERTFGIIQALCECLDSLIPAWKPI
jgi:hypothetical protein